MLQKFVNYRIKAAFYGDYACHTDKPREFLRKPNGSDGFFLAKPREEAIETPVRK